MKNLTLAGAGFGFFLLSMSGMYAADPYSCGYGGLNDKPIVPNEKVASDIFRAIVSGYNPYALKRFPDITVRNAGDHWVVSQMNLAAAEKSHDAAGGEVVTIKKKGQITINIDKCIGTVTKAEVGE